MRSLQDLTDIFREVAKKQNIQGDSAEVLIQLLANAAYISEVENIAYAQEASLEKATLINSKIQHCMNEMYSVFRGSCPRVLINFKPTKYFSFNVFDEIVSSNNFKVYYLGYYSSGKNEIMTGAASIAVEENFIYAPVTIPPALNDETYTIIGLLAKDTVVKNWSLNKNNTYYVDCTEEELSNDMWVKINGEYFDSSRQFTDHILNGQVFDMTIPSFGSRLYVADILRSNFMRAESNTPTNTKIEAKYFKFSELSGYNESELRKINLRGAELVSFDRTWLASRKSEELSTGICCISEIPRDDVSVIHYKANRDRYVNSILRSNSDIGVILEEMYPNKVRSGGTSYKFLTSSDNSNIQIYYVPYNNSNLLTSTEIQEFISTRSSYYVTDLIDVIKGSQYTAVFSIDLELYQSTNVDNEVKDILESYGEQFNVNLDEKLEEIKSLISKISNVKQILGIDIIYTSEDGTQLTEERKEEVLNNLDKSYFSINYVLNSIVQTKN